MSEIFHHNFPRKNIDPFQVISGIMYQIFGKWSTLSGATRKHILVIVNCHPREFLPLIYIVHVIFKIWNLISEHRYLLMIEVIKNSFFFSCFLCRKNSGLGVRNPYRASHWPIILSSIMACWSRNKLKRNIQNVKSFNDQNYSHIHEICNNDIDFQYLCIDGGFRNFSWVLCGSMKNKNSSGNNKYKT